jgi:hypothetical protein
MKDILEEAGVQITKENKKEIDRIIHNLMGVEYKNCSPAWKAVKDHIRGDEKTRSRFIKKLNDSLKSL